MLDNIRIIVVTPAGRKKYLEILFKYIGRLRPIVDEYRLWVNTENKADINYMIDFQKANKDYVSLDYLPKGVKVNGNKTINYFFKRCTNQRTIYVRFDDDIVYIDDIEKFKQFLLFRLNNPKYFLVYGNIINNAICSHLHQLNGALGGELVKYNCFDEVGWKDGNFAKSIHYKVFENFNDLSSFRMKNLLLNNFERVSINCISWNGDCFRKFSGNVLGDEEKYISCEKPREMNLKNIIYGDFLCIHYAFFTQREIVDKDIVILSTYKQKSLN